MRPLVLVVLRFLIGLALRAFALLLLTPLFDGRVISAPRVKKSILSGKTVLQEGEGQKQTVNLDAQPAVISKSRHWIAPDHASVPGMKGCHKIPTQRARTVRRPNHRELRLAMDAVSSVGGQVTATIPQAGIG